VRTSQSLTFELYVCVIGTTFSIPAFGRVGDVAGSEGSISRRGPSAARGEEGCRMCEWGEGGMGTSFVIGLPGRKRKTDKHT
jgi:hypothetical protein